MIFRLPEKLPIEITASPMAGAYGLLSELSLKYPGNVIYHPSLEWYELSPNIKKAANNLYNQFPARSAEEWRLVEEAYENFIQELQLEALR